MTDASSSSPRWRESLAVLFRQIGQIHFQRSALSGLAIVLALASVNLWAAIGAVFASAVALATAKFARLPRAPRYDGLYGYNAALTGAGLLSFFAPGLEVFGYLGVVSAVTALVSSRWVAWGRLPALTIQFVLAMWLALALGDALGARLSPPGCENGWTSIFCNVGQVTFISGLWPGLVVLLAFAWHDKHEALWLAIGAAFAWLASNVLDAFAPGLRAGEQLVGLAVNAALVGQGLTVFGRGVAVRVAGIVLSVPVCLALGAFAIPYFTLPFNLVTWALLIASAERKSAPQPARHAA
ncbi:urea transporter [Crenobacter cavernae]|nr:urea transporter [Crenobacter cavernae]